MHYIKYVQAIFSCIQSLIYMQNQFILMSCQRVENDEIIITLIMADLQRKIKMVPKCG